MRLSITTVEAYRLWRDHEWMGLDDLLATIRKDAPANDNMLRGKAFHSILEHPSQYDMQEDGYCADGWSFDYSGIQNVLKLLPIGRVAEVKETADVDGITLVGVADALHGLDVYEAKCTGRIDTERYFDSFQWRAYLKLFNAQRVYYLLAQYYERGGIVTLPNVLPLPLYRYPKLDDDVKRLTTECADFILRRGLQDYVQDKAA